MGLSEEGECSDSKPITDFHLLLSPPTPTAALPGSISIRALMACGLRSPGSQIVVDADKLLRKFNVP